MNNYIGFAKARLLSSFRVVSLKPLNALQQKTGGRLGDGVDKDEIRPYFRISLNEVILCIVSGSRNTTQNLSKLMTAAKFVLNIYYQAYFLSLALYSLLFYKPFIIENLLPLNFWCWQTHSFFQNIQTATYVWSIEP